MTGVGAETVTDWVSFLRQILSDIIEISNSKLEEKTLLFKVMKKLGKAKKSTLVTALKGFVLFEV